MRQLFPSGRACSRFVVVFGVVILVGGFLFAIHSAYGTTYYRNDTHAVTDSLTSSYGTAVFATPNSTQTSSVGYVGFDYVAGSGVDNGFVSNVNSYGADSITFAEAWTGGSSCSWNYGGSYWYDYWTPSHGNVAFVATTTDGTYSRSVFSVTGGGVVNSYPFHFDSSRCMSLSVLGVGNNYATLFGSTIPFIGNSNSGGGWNVTFADTAAEALAMSSTPPQSYYAQMQGGTHHLYEAEDTSTILKTLPADWIIHVESSTDGSGDPMVSGGYHWFKVSDPTDGTMGWMAASNTTSQYISSYDGSGAIQGDMYTSSSVQIATGTTEDADLILGAIDHYYNNADTNDSLYSSDDDTGLVNGNSSQNRISRLKERNYPEQLILGIAAWEDGRDPYDFDNQWMSYDYGGGIMQNTFAAWWNEPDNYADNSWDIRGYGSGVTIPPCKSVGSNLYENCYANAGTQNKVLKPYQHYGGVSTNPKYLQYTNTPQSIYANIKDGMKDLSQSYFVRDLANDPTGTDNRICNYTSSTVSVTYGTSTIDYSCLDREIILTTADYNGGGYGNIDPSTGSSTNYLYHVASTTLNISNYFATTTNATTTAIADKMIIANASSVYVQLHSPGDLSVQDDLDHIIGMVNGAVVNTFPFASYDAHAKTARIFFPQSNNLAYKVTGTGTGVYGLDIDISDGSRQTSFHRDEVAPIVPGQIDTYTIDQDAIANHKNGVALKTDLKGVGKVDLIKNFAGAVNIFSPGNISKIPYGNLPKMKQSNNAVVTPRLLPALATSTIQVPSTTRLIFNTSSTLFSSSSPSLMNASSTVSSTVGN